MQMSYAKMMVPFNVRIATNTENRNVVVFRDTEDEIIG